MTHQFTRTASGAVQTYTVRGVGLGHKANAPIVFLWFDSTAKGYGDKMVEWEVKHFISALEPNSADHLVPITQVTVRQVANIYARNGWRDEA